ncbi:MAG: class I SAM-dependent methyltransferase [Candidatus Thiodiazotropha sp.]
MVMNRPEAYETATEREMMERLLPLRGANLLELGCGAAWITRQLAQQYPDSHFTATEVDRIQHEKNLALPAAANLEFCLGGAESIEAESGSVDIVCMLKSLHHVPHALMAAAMEEIVRVLKPGGLAYFCEPVYSGEFNALMSLIHDEKVVRTQAFEAIKGLVDSGRMRLVGEYFFNVPGCYASWELFEDRFINITHTELAIDQARYEKIKKSFLAHMGPGGAEFLKPHRVDVLRKPADLPA